MMNGIKINIFNKYLEIKQDLMNNLDEVFLRKNYYTKKYRGNLNTDINVSLEYGLNEKDKIIQIFVRHQGLYVRDRLMYNYKGLMDSNITTNLNE